MPGNLRQVLPLQTKSRSFAGNGNGRLQIVLAEGPLNFNTLYSSCVHEAVEDSREGVRILALTNERQGIPHILISTTWHIVQGSLGLSPTKIRKPSWIVSWWCRVLITRAVKWNEALADTPGAAGTTCRVNFS